MEVRALLRTDDRAAFSSGNPDLDRFFRQFAGQNQFRNHIGVTYVAVEDGRVLGYATVSPATVEITSLPAAVRKGLPGYPLPVLRLARLAVDQSLQRRGVGSQLLRYVLHMAIDMADKYGCLGVLVDAKPEAVDYYRGYGFSVVAADEVAAGASNVRPHLTMMFLMLSEIRKALRLGREE